MSGTSDESAAELIRRARRSTWTVRIVMAFFAVWAVLVLVWLIPVAIRFPGVSVPALLSATAGYIAARRRGIRAVDAGRNSRELSPLEGRTILWGLIGGALGGMVLAGLKIGLPLFSKQAPLGWRLLGGLVFGAGAGIAAGFLPPILELVIGFWSRRRAA